MSRSRAGLSFLLVTSTIAASLALPPFGAMEASARKPKSLKRTSPGRVLVVSVNIHENHYSDVQDVKDLRLFVRRLANQVPRVPDVLLVQELWGRSSYALASILRESFGNRFEVVQNAADPPWRQPSSTTVLGTDSAILINAGTMSAPGSSGMMTLSYDISEAARGRNIRAKRHPLALVEEKRGGFRLPVVSVHFPKTEHFKSVRVSRNVKRRWVRQINRRLYGDFHSRALRRNLVIAGDLNNPRCNRRKRPCKPTLAYQAMTRRLRYTDAVQALNGWSNPIDFVFARANVSTSGEDRITGRGRTEYSDHIFRWALLEKKDRTKPTPPGRISKARGNKKRVKLAGWRKALDGGTGFAHYKVRRSRRGPNRGFHVIGRARKIWFRDTNVSAGETYWYRVVAYDRSGNRSRTSAPIRVRAGRKPPDKNPRKPKRSSSTLPGVTVTKGRLPRGAKAELHPPKTGPAAETHPPKTGPAAETHPPKPKPNTERHPSRRKPKAELRPPPRTWR